MIIDDTGFWKALRSDYAYEWLTRLAATVQEDAHIDRYEWITEDGKDMLVWHGYVNVWRNDSSAENMRMEWQINNDEIGG